MSPAAMFVTAQRLPPRMDVRMDVRMDARMNARVAARVALAPRMNARMDARMDARIAWTLTMSVCHTLRGAPCAPWTQLSRSL